MQVSELMTKTPATVRRDTPLQEAAQRMKDHDCGALPVVEGEDDGRPVGVVTDRDITVRVVAAGKNPQELTVKDAMTESTVTLRQGDTDEEAEQLMEEHQIRRLIVVDDNDRCVGIVSQADLALREPEEETGEVVKEVSKPSGKA